MAWSGVVCDGKRELLDRRTGEPRISRRHRRARSFYSASSDRTRADEDQEMLFYTRDLLKATQLPQSALNPLPHVSSLHASHRVNPIACFDSPA